MNLRDGRVATLAELARQQGWRLEENGTRLIWYPPDTAKHPISSPKRFSSENGHDFANILGELRRAGLQVQPTGLKESATPPQQPDPPTPLVERFVRDLAALIEDELDLRTRNLQDQVTALQNDNQDLRQRLADSESDVEERARQAAARAVEEVLAARRLKR